MEKEVVNKIRKYKYWSTYYFFILNDWSEVKVTKYDWNAYMLLENKWYRIICK